MEPSEEVPLPIPASLRSHMEDECFWILCQNKVVHFQYALGLANTPLLKLPRKPTVEDLLRQFYYQNIATPSEDMSPALLAEVLDGIKIYFDFMIEDHLLYAPEREQFKSVITDRNKTTPTVAAGQQTPTTNSLETASTPHLEHTPQGNPWQQKPQLEPTTDVGTPGGSLLIPSQVYGAEHLLRLFLKFPLFLCHAQLPPAHVQLLHPYFKEVLGYLAARREELFSEENYESTNVGGGSGSGERTKTESAATQSGCTGEMTAPPNSSTPISIS